MFDKGHKLQIACHIRRFLFDVRQRWSCAVMIWAAVALLALCGCTREKDPNRTLRIQWKAGQSPVEITPGRHASIRSTSPTKDKEVRLDDYGEKAFWFAIGGSAELGKLELLDALPVYVQAAGHDQVVTVDIRWSADGLKSVLLVNGQAEAVFDFENEFGMCRMDRPYTEDLPWSGHGKKWNEAILKDFEGLKAGPAR